MSEVSKTNILGVILAGGLSRRMGGEEKAFLCFGEQTLIENAIGRLRAQVSEIIINANGDPERFAHLKLLVLADTLEGHLGPLAGVLTTMEYVTENKTGHSHIMTVAVDTPYFPINLVNMMGEAIDHPEKIVMAGSNQRHHPVFGLWPVAHMKALRRAIEEENIRKVMLFAKRYPLEIIEFNVQPDDLLGDPFFNINTPEDLKLAVDRLPDFGVLT